MYFFTGFRGQINIILLTLTLCFRGVAACGSEWLRCLLYSVLDKPLTLQHEMLRGIRACF